MIQIQIQPLWSENVEMNESEFKSAILGLRIKFAISYFKLKHLEITQIQFKHTLQLHLPPVFPHGPTWTPILARNSWKSHTTFCNKRRQVRLPYWTVLGRWYPPEGGKGEWLLCQWTQMWDLLESDSYFGGSSSSQTTKAVRSSMGSFSYSSMV